MRARARTHTHALEHATLRSHWLGYRGVLAHTRTHIHLRETQATHTPHSRARAQEHNNTTQTLAATAVASSLLSLRVHGGSAPLLSLCFTYGSGVDRWAEFGERSLDLITRSRSHAQHNANSTAGLRSISRIGYVRVQWAQCPFYAVPMAPVWTGGQCFGQASTKTGPRGGPRPFMALLLIVACR